MITIQQQPLTPEIKDLVYQGFAEAAMESTGMNGLADDPLVFFVSEAGDVQGCIAVQLFWGQLHIKYLFVAKAFRGKGLGRTLVEHALTWGTGQGCTFAFVETMSFQAPAFYQNLGFEIELTRPGYAKDSSFHYLKRALI